MQFRSFVNFQNGSFQPQKPNKITTMINIHELQSYQVDILMINEVVQK